MQSSPSSTGAGFVGRQREIATLRGRLDDAFGGRSSIVLLVGEPGVGKTRTAQELAGQARRRGARVLWGRCHEGEGAPPFWPWIQLLRSYVGDADPATLETQLGVGAAEIAQLLPELRQRLPTLPQPPVLESAQARFRLFDAVVSFLGQAASTRPLVLVLDDLHWADRSSLSLLEFLARELPGGHAFTRLDNGGAGLVVVGAYRDVEVSRGDALARTLGELVHEAVERIELEGLAAREVARFMEATAGRRLPDALVDAVYHETEGNPFFVTEVVRLLAAEGQLDGADEQTSWELRVPNSVRDAVQRRLDRLSAICNRLLTIAAIVGREFTVSVLGRLSGLARERVLEVLDEATTARVVTVMADAAGRYRFAHALIRETLYEELTVGLRVQLHRQVGDVLEEAYRVDADAHTAELAHHFFQAAPGGAVEKAVAYAVRAAERAARMLAHEEAVRHYQLALRALELAESLDDNQACALLLALGEAQNRAGDREAAKQTFLRAADRARTLKAPAALARAALGFGGVVLTGGVVDATLVGLLEEAAAAVGPHDSPVRARLLARLAQELYFSEAPDARERRFRLSREAVEMARRTGDRSALAAALFSRYMAIWDPDNLQERLEVATETVRLAAETGDRELALQGHRWRMPTLLELGDLPAVTREMAAHARLAEALRQPLYLWDARRWSAMHALLQGQFGEAEQLIPLAAGLGRRALPGTASMYLVLHLYTLRREQGRLAEVEASLNQLIERQPGVIAWRCWLAQLHAELGREPKAKQEFDRLAADDYAVLPKDLLWLPAMSLLAQVCSLVGDPPRAAALYAHLEPYAKRTAVVGSAVVCYGAVSRYLGLLAATAATASSQHQRGLDDTWWERAARHFQDALATNQRIGARPFVAYTQYEYASMLLDRGRPDDQPHARSLLTAAGDTAEELGMGRLADLARARLQTASTMATRKQRGRAGGYPDRLTEREVEVLRLVALGRSNRQIADELHVSINTVLRHVSNIFAKISATNRAQAATYAAHHGLLP